MTVYPAELIDKTRRDFHPALGKLIYSLYVDVCSHCECGCVPVQVIRLHESDPFYFQYCATCWRHIDHELARMEKRQGKAA